MRRTHHLIATCFAVIAVAGSAAAASANTPASTGDVVESMDLQPFTHVTYIPAGSSMSSIRIENIKLVKIATKRRILTNDRDCHQPWAEPGGSMACSRTIDESTVPAYRVTYSYRGEPMMSDEYGNTYFTFSVYFRPDEIPPRLRDILALGEIRRTALEEFFRVTTSRGLVQQTVIDSAHSAFCDGNYVDGNWTRVDPRCDDQIAYKPVTSPSPYIAVSVEPSLSRVETALVSGSWLK